MASSSLGLIGRCRPGGSSSIATSRITAARSRSIQPHSERAASPHMCFTTIRPLLMVAGAVRLALRFDL
ncbi:MAG TPA: hypothetical protein VK524_29970 [Polyangiaceae bacterium]|nr:hypothetical protein [Polyangiaceae bacterium]